MPDTQKRGLAILECTEEIPCNPCAAVCKTGAIEKKDLNACPVLHPEKCAGCKLCVAACPGQAIFLQMPNYDETSATITFPYEYLPLPSPGQTVEATNRLGRVICPAKVLEVETRGSFNKTNLVTLKIPKAHRDEIRFMKRLPKTQAPSNTAKEAPRHEG